MVMNCNANFVEVGRFQRQIVTYLYMKVSNSGQIWIYDSEQVFGKVSKYWNTANVTKLMLLHNSTRGMTTHIMTDSS